MVDFRNLWFDTNLLEEGRQSRGNTSTPSSPQQWSEKESDKEEEWLKKYISQLLDKNL